MHSKKYTVDSIERGQVKLLLREDESIEKLIPVEKFSFDIREGDIVLIAEENGQLKMERLTDEKEDILRQIRALKKELLDRND